MNGEAAAYFWANLNIQPEVGCKVWPFPLDAGGYGYVVIDGHRHQVHRLACEAHHGQQPAPRWVVAHAPVICHNRACWHRDHIRWASPKENSTDRWHDKTDRSRRSGNPMPRNGSGSTLTEEVVARLRADYDNGATVTDLVDCYGLSASRISKIVNGKTWAHSFRGSFVNQEGTRFDLPPGWPQPGRRKRWPGL